METARGQSQCARHSSGRSTVLRTLRQSSSRVWGECYIPGASFGARGAVCPGRRGQGGTAPGVPGLGLEPRRGQGWEHGVIGWSFGCGSGRARAQSGWMWVSPPPAGRLHTGRIGNDLVVPSASFLTKVCVSLQWRLGLAQKGCCALQPCTGSDAEEQGRGGWPCRELHSQRSCGTGLACS